MLLKIYLFFPQIDLQVVKKIEEILGKCWYTSVGQTDTCLLSLFLPVALSFGRFLQQKHLNSAAASDIQWA